MKSPGFENVFSDNSTRRIFLGSAAAATAALVIPQGRLARAEGESPRNTYENHATGIRVLPGSWRPHYAWEHIAWVSPSWPSQDYLWLDFPEAIFTSQGLLYLSHVNPPIHTVYHDLPPVPWKKIPAGVTFERRLPNGVSFGASVRRGSGTTVDLELHIRNGSQKKLANISLQTCVFLRAVKEFADYTRDNKFVHVPGKGWVAMDRAATMKVESAKYRIGWRGGKAVSDLPVAVTVSNQAERLVAMTWFESTISMVSNPVHPCMHADPRFRDLDPGEASSVRGKLIFFEGKLRDFDFRKLSGS